MVIVDVRVGFKGGMSIAPFLLMDGPSYKLFIRHS